ncbi:uncharacterized protein [Procambarus clarkii]|uniref:uncharacterized protein n=1 Tax=Procambarus clarkii TaxID=6728 RepID=UPI0037442C5A
MVRVRLRRKILLVLLTAVITLEFFVVRTLDGVTWWGHPGDLTRSPFDTPGATVISYSNASIAEPDSKTSFFSSFVALPELHENFRVSKYSGSAKTRSSGNGRTLNEPSSWEPGHPESYETITAFDFRRAEGQNVQQPERRGIFIRQRKSISNGLKKQINATGFQDLSWSSQTSTVSIFTEEVTPSSSSLDPTDTSTSSAEIYDTDYYYNYEDNTITIEIIPGMKQISFTKVLFLCEYIFSAVYGRYSNFTDTLIPYGNMSLAIVSNQRFFNVCVPFYQQLYGSECVEMNQITVCYPEEIAFLHATSCRRPSSEDKYFEQLRATMLLAKDDVCHQAVCNGTLRVVERSTEGITILLISPYATRGNNGSCYKYVQILLEESLAGKGAYVTSNRNWPSCFPGYDVWWTAEPEAVGLVRSWSYLPLRCRAGEGFLMVVVICIAVSGLLGNGVVLAVMVRGSHQNEASDILRTSLAAADILLCLFVVMPGLDAHISFMDGRSVVSDGVSSELLQTPGGSIVLDGGFRLFSAIVMSSCSCISLLSLFALSLERFATTTDTTQHGVIFTRARALGYVVVTWMSSLLVSVALTNGEDGILALWYSFYKLPIGVAPRGLQTLLPVTAAILGLVCLLTAILSSLTLHNDIKKETRRTTELRDLGDTELDQSSTEMMKYVVVIMSLATGLFLLSTTLAGGACLLHILDAHFDGVELVGYLCWWGFIAASAWNPFLYNLPSQRFREDAGALIRTVMQKKLIYQSWIHRHTPRRQQEAPWATTDVRTSHTTPGAHQTLLEPRSNPYRVTTV